MFDFLHIVKDRHTSILSFLGSFPCWTLAPALRHFLALIFFIVRVRFSKRTYLFRVYLERIADICTSRRHSSYGSFVVIFVNTTEPAGISTHTIAILFLMLLSQLKAWIPSFSVLCFPTRETHITSDMCAGAHISRRNAYHCDTGSILEARHRKIIKTLRYI